MVVMPEYLTTTPKQTPSKPRIISEVKKNCFSKLKLGFTTSLQDFGKSKYSGQLLWNTGNSEWVPRIAEVRQGNLILINKETSSVDLKQPLRELNLRACNAPRTFCLAEAKGVRLLVFQALTEDEYEKWVRILAVELIRQTPLQNVRFLDILSIIRNKEPEGVDLRKGSSEECISKQEENLLEPKDEQINSNKEENGSGFKTKKIKVVYQKSVPVVSENSQTQKSWFRTQSMNNLANSEKDGRRDGISDESGISSGDENQGECPRDVDSFSFISVRERKNFFESLNSESEAKKPENPGTPLVRSNSIGNFKQVQFVPDRSRFHRRKRTKSLHDLHKTPVKEICQLFESQERKTEKIPEGSETVERNAMAVITQRRLQRGERKLEKLKNQIADVEETIKTVAEDIKSIGHNTLKRKEGLELFAGLQKRLDEENSRLERLTEEMNRVLKGNQRTMLKLERCSDNR